MPCALAALPQLRRHDKSRLRFRSGAGGRSLGRDTEGGAGGWGDRMSATEGSPLDNLRREVCGVCSTELAGCEWHECCLPYSAGWVWSSGARAVVACSWGNRLPSRGRKEWRCRCLANLTSHTTSGVLPAIWHISEQLQAFFACLWLRLRSLPLCRWR